VIRPTRQGLVVVLDPDTGEPMWPVESEMVAVDLTAGRILRRSASPMISNIPVQEFAASSAIARAMAGLRLAPLPS
jgi:hypothetical protein